MAPPDAPSTGDDRGALLGSSGVTCGGLGATRWRLAAGEPTPGAGARLPTNLTFPPVGSRTWRTVRGELSNAADAPG